MIEQNKSNRQWVTVNIERTDSMEKPALCPIINLLSSTANYYVTFTRKFLGAAALNKAKRSLYVTVFIFSSGSYLNVRIASRTVMVYVRVYLNDVYFHLF